MGFNAWQFLNTSLETFAVRGWASILTQNTVSIVNTKTKPITSWILDSQSVLRLKLCMKGIVYEVTVQLYSLILNVWLPESNFNLDSYH